MKEKSEGIERGEREGMDGWRKGEKEREGENREGCSETEVMESYTGKEKGKRKGGRQTRGRREERGKAGERKRGCGRE